MRHGKGAPSPPTPARYRRSLPPSRKRIVRGASRTPGAACLHDGFLVHPVADEAAWAAADLRAFGRIQEAPPFGGRRQAPAVDFDVDTDIGLVGKHAGDQAARVRQVEEHAIGLEQEGLAAAGAPEAQAGRRMAQPFAQQDAQHGARADPVRAQRRRQAGRALPLIRRQQRMPVAGRGAGVGQRDQGEVHGRAHPASSSPASKRACRRSRLASKSAWLSPANTSSPT